MKKLSDKAYRHNGSKRYRREPHHKAKSEEWHLAKREKKEWRQHKKRQDHHGYYRYPPCRDVKRQRAVEHRAWVREQLKRENWEAFYDTSVSAREYNRFVDPWTWD